MGFNPCSLGPEVNRYALYSIMDKEKPDIVVISESRTKSKPYCPLAEYDCIAADFAQDSKQGTAIFVKKSLQIVPTPFSKTTKNITIFKLITHRHTHLFVAGIYIPPHGCEERMPTIHELENLLDEIS